MGKGKHNYQRKFFKKNIQHNFYKTEKLHFLKNIKNITGVFGKAEILYLEKAKNIGILDIHKYEGHILSRFFYGIYNIEKNKGWIRLSGVSIDDFFIKIGMIEKHFYDVNIGNTKGIFADSKNIDRWNNIRYKKRFTNNQRECYKLEDLYYILKRIGASANFIKTIFSEYKNTYSGDRKLQYKFFEELRRLNDGDKESLINKYKMRLNRIGKEYKEFIYKNT